MIEFNPDGSIKIPDTIAKGRRENEHRMRVGRCLTVKKEMVNFTSPKKCVLHLRLSDAITDSSFIQDAYRRSNESSKTPCKITKLNDMEFDIEIGSDFKRCSDCSNLIKIFRECLYDNVIEEKGNCPHAERKQGFCYEDHFE